MMKTVTQFTLCSLAALALSTQAVSAMDDGQEFKDWTARCGSPAEGAPSSCVLEQIVFSEDGSRPMLRAAAGYIQEDKAKAVPAVLFTVPLMVALEQGLAVSVDGQGAFVARYHHCNPEGCVAGLPLDKTVLGSFKKGSKAAVQLLAINGQAVQLTLSLSGFTAGYNALPSVK